MFLNYKIIYNSKSMVVYNKNKNIKFFFKAVNVYNNFFLIKNDFVFFCNNFFFKTLKLIIFKINKIFLFSYCGFLYSKIFLMVGLGFKKKYFDLFNSYCMDIGRRKWVIFKLEPSGFFFNLFRKNICILTSSKKKLSDTMLKLKGLRNETVYKTKGIFTRNRIIFSRKISRSVLFARRIKFKKLKLKPTKKQKLKK